MGRRDSRMRRCDVPHLHGAHRSNMTTPVFLRRRLYTKNLPLSTQVTYLTSLFRRTASQPYSKVLLYKLIVAQPVKKFTALWDPKVHYCFHSSLLLSPIMGQFNPVHAAFRTWFTIQSKVAQVTQRANSELMFQKVNTTYSLYTF
jgi:hypothetical protein